MFQLTDDDACGGGDLAAEARNYAGRQRVIESKGIACRGRAEQDRKLK